MSAGGAPWGRGQRYTHTLQKGLAHHPLQSPHGLPLCTAPRHKHRTTRAEVVGGAVPRPEGGPRSANDTLLVLARHHLVEHEAHTLCDDGVVGEAALGRVAHVSGSACHQLLHKLWKAHGGGHRAQQQRMKNSQGTRDTGEGEEGRAQKVEEGGVGGPARLGSQALHTCLPGQTAQHHAAVLL